jgi:hypothetical protein
MKLLAIVCLLTSLVCARSDQESDSSTKAVHSLADQYSTYIGLAGGYTSGYGLSFRQWYKSKWGIQLTLFPLYLQQKNGDIDNSSSGVADSGWRDYANISLGFLLLRELAQFRFGRIVYYAGTNALVNYEKYNYYTTETTWQHNDSIYFPVDSVEHHVGRNLSDKITLGTGAGSEFYVWRFAFHLMLGFCAAYDVELKEFSIMPTVEGGIQFRLM